MGKVVDLNTLQYLRDINSFPKEYEISIQRKAGLVTVDNPLIEEFDFLLSDNVIDSPLTDFLLLHHALGIALAIAEKDPSYRKDIIQVLEDFQTGEL